MIHFPNFKCSHVFIDEKVAFVCLFNLLEYSILNMIVLLVGGRNEKNSCFGEGLGLLWEDF